jgi:hypothetical protein
VKAAEIKALFPTEAALCDTFAQDLQEQGGWTICPETAGFDLLCVRDDTGHPLGVEAKLSLNAKVADQILPSDFMGCRGVRRVPTFERCWCPSSARRPPG